MVLDNFNGNSKSIYNSKVCEYLDTHPLIRDKCIAKECLHTAKLGLLISVAYNQHLNLEKILIEHRIMK